LFAPLNRAATSLFAWRRDAPFPICDLLWQNEVEVADGEMEKKGNKSIKYIFVCVFLSCMIVWPGGLRFDLEFNSGDPSSNRSIKSTRVAELWNKDGVGCTRPD
jgi:hypothetical protein